MPRKKCRHWADGEVFSLDIPFNRTMLHAPMPCGCPNNNSQPQARLPLLPLLEDFRRFQRGRQCYLFLIVVCGACQLPESQDDNLLCRANFTFQAVQGEFRPLLVGSGSATAGTGISQLHRSRVFPSLTNEPGQWANTL